MLSPSGQSLRTVPEKLKISLRRRLCWPLSTNGRPIVDKRSATLERCSGVPERTTDCLLKVSRKTSSGGERRGHSAKGFSNDLVSEFAQDCTRCKPDCARQPGLVQNALVRGASCARA